MDNETVVREFIRTIWNERKIDRIQEFVADDYTVYRDNADPWEGKSLDHSEFKLRLNYSFTSFPDIHFEIKKAISDAAVVAIVWVMTGTNTGKIGDIEPTGKRFEADGITIYHFNNGKLCGHTQGIRQDRHNETTWIPGVMQIKISN